MKHVVIALFILTVSLGLACGKAVEPPDGGSATSAPGESIQLAQGAATPPAASAESADAQASPEVRAVELRKNGTAPDIEAKDIHRILVDLDKIIADKPDLIIEFFFTVSSGEEIAKKLKFLDARYGEKVRIVALGIQEEEKALQEFAEGLDIPYHIIDSKQLGDESWLEQVDALPITLFVHPDEDRIIVKVLRGTGTAKANIIKDVAVALMQQGAEEDAANVADLALEAGEDEKAVHEAKGYIFTAAGKLDEAEAEFGQIDSKAGLAKVALERGELDKAVELSSQDPSGYAATIKARALMRGGKLDKAEAALGAAKPAEDWQRAEATAIEGRLHQEKGDTDAAVEKYREAVSLDFYNVEALSNEGALYREQGHLAKAAQVLEEADKRRDDDLVGMMLRQVKKEMEDANDLKRTELIRKQIADLSARYKELKAAGMDKPADEWTTRPLIVAFLPSERSTPVFFERAGTDIALRRELEARLQGLEHIQVVERDLLDKLLQELELGSSELADQDNQLRLGKVLSAQLLGFVDFAQAGPDVTMYLRMIKSETTRIETQVAKAFRANTDLDGMMDAFVQELVNKIAAKRRLQGLIAEATDDTAVIINLGAKHGVQPGQRFSIIEEGDPIEAGGKVIGRRQVTVGVLEVKEVQEGLSICSVLQKNEDVQLAKDTKVKEVYTR